MELPIISYISYTFLLGLVPPIIWLAFWLREDEHPEPKKEIALVFVAGMASVILAVFFENNIFSINSYFRKAIQYSQPTFQLINIIGFAFVEELVKAGAAYATALRSKFFDEPVDAMVYMVVAALGFAALENVFFIAESMKGGLDQSIIVSAFRFINASLLHVSASAIVGAGLAMSFFHHEKRKKELILGILSATLLHIAYNFFIINSAWSASTQIGITLIVLGGAVAALVLFEKARREIV